MMHDDSRSKRVKQAQQEGPEVTPEWRDGRLVVISNADTGETIGTTSIRRGGEWKFRINLKTAPCRIRATINNEYDEKNVKDAPANCDNGTGHDPDAVVVNEAKLESENADSKLEVKVVKSHPQSSEKQ